MKQVTAWFRYYNPLLQKPTSLEPVMPWGFWWYYGPDPAAGCSYGTFVGESGHEIITKQANTVYSPVDGKPMHLVEPIDLSKVINPDEAQAATPHQYKCEGCGEQMVSNHELIDKGFCTACGHEMTFHSSHKENKAMNTDLKEKVRAHILKKRAEAKKAATPETAEASVEQQKQALRAKIKARLAERKAGKATAADEWIDLDEVLEDKKAKANEAEPPGQDLEQHENAKEEEKEGKLLASDEKEEKSEEKPAEEAKEGEEFMPLDMVLSALERKQRIERIRANLAEKRKARAAQAKADADKATAAPAAPAVEVKEEQKAKETRAAKVAAFKARIAAKLKARAAAAATQVKAEEEEKPVEKKADKADKKEEGKANEECAPEMKEKEEAKSSEAPVLEKPVDAPKAANPEAVNEVGHQEKEMDVLEHASEAMKYEPLAGLDSLKTIAREDIDMIRYDEDTENPFWNVSVKGTPVARVSLKAQVSADEIRNVFISDDYAMDLIEHCATSGLVDTLKKVNATFYANHTSDKKVAASFKAAADKTIATARAELSTNFKGDFLNCLRIAIAGINKNFYPALGNPLKEQLFLNMHTLGLPESSAKSIVEKAFAEASAEYFDSVFTKADEYMKMSQEARHEIAEAISQAASIDPQSAGTQEPATLSNRLAQASVAPQMTMSFESRPLVADVDDFKARLKRSWKPTR